jgi:nucleoid-associated protein YgaU
LQFVRGNNERLALELYFDVTKRGPEADASNQPTDVRELSGRLEKLARIASETHAPPRIRLTWGKLSFTAIIEKVVQRFTLFKSDGTPLRAFVMVTLRRYQTLKEQLQTLNLQSADHTRVWEVRNGDNLGSIAHQAYGEAGLWRHIALHPANARRIDDLRRLPPGLRLELPRLNSDSPRPAP